MISEKGTECLEKSVFHPAIRNGRTGSFSRVGIGVGVCGISRTGVFVARAGLSCEPWSGTGVGWTVATAVGCGAGWTVAAAVGRGAGWAFAAAEGCGAGWTVAAAVGWGVGWTIVGAVGCGSSVGAAAGVLVELVHATATNATTPARTANIRRFHMCYPLNLTEIGLAFES